MSLWLAKDYIRKALLRPDDMEYWLKKALKEIEEVEAKQKEKP